MTQSPQISLHHRTEYHYDRAVVHGPHEVRLRPAPHNRTPVLRYAQTIEPHDHFVNWQQDVWSNWIARLVINEPSDRLIVDIDLVVQLDVLNPFDFFLSDHAQNVETLYLSEQDWELEPFVSPKVHTKRLLEFVKSAPKKTGNTLDFIVAINAYVNQAISYIVRMEPGVLTPDECLERGKGSCRDSAWLLIQLMRHFGLAARFVSGYLIQLRPDDDSSESGSGPEADFTELHAWAEVYLPGAGWVGLDPTSGLLAGEGHIPLACAPMPTAAAPIVGTTQKCEVRLKHEISVKRLNDPMHDQTHVRCA